MSRILVTGGTGNLGKRVVDVLLKKDFRVRVLTTRKNAPAAKGSDIFIGDLSTGSGLTEAVRGVGAIIHCASDSKNFKEVDIKGTANLLSIAKKARLGHFVYISIVGVDKSSYPYYLAKFNVEEMISKSGIPFTILRTTQFHNFVLEMIEKLLMEEKKGYIPVPAGLKFQSIEISEVAMKLVECLGGPAGLLPDIGGPKVLSFEEMMREYLDVTRKNKKVETLDLEGGRFELFRSGVNLCPNNAFGKITWQSFLEDHF